MDEKPRIPPAVSPHLGMTLDYLERMQVLRELQDESDNEEKRQLNLRLSLSTLNGLEKIADHFDDNRTAVATLLLQAAIADVCEHLGIEWKLRDQQGNLAPDIEE